MKKIFAICAVALVACVMFTSCSKDETTNKNAATVTFNGTSWKAGQFYADVTPQAAHDYITMIVAEDFANNDMPYASGFVGGTANQTYTYDPQHPEESCFFTYCETHTAPEWMCKSGSQEITDLDLNGKTISARCVEVVTKNNVDADLIVDMNNAEWTAQAISKRR